MADLCLITAPSRMSSQFASLYLSPYQRTLCISQCCYHQLPPYLALSYLDFSPSCLSPFCTDKNCIQRRSFVALRPKHRKGLETRTLRWPRCLPHSHPTRPRSGPTPFPQRLFILLTFSEIYPALQNFIRFSGVFLLEIQLFPQSSLAKVLCTLQIDHL